MKKGRGRQEREETKTTMLEISWKEKNVRRKNVIRVGKHGRKVKEKKEDKEAGYE